MEPERGDPAIEVRQTDVTRALRAIGVRPGDTLLFHSSLSSMGTVVGGPDAVIDGFLEAVGLRGTVAAPTLCQRDKERRFETWDIERSPSDAGRITEVFRRRSEAIRSDHPTHSVAAIGRRAAELTGGHATAGGRPGPWGPAAFAPGSPWDRLCHWNAAILLVGVDFHVNTMMHYIQSLVVERAVAGLAPSRRRALLTRVHGWQRPGVWPHYPDSLLEPRRAQAGLVTYGRLGSATLRHIPARGMVNHALVVLERAPETWFDEPFLEWYREARKG